jgi:hypothetical protein
LFHAEQIKTRNLSNLGKEQSPAKKVIISETDGCMIGIIETGVTGDKRKGKKANWKEINIPRGRAAGYV